MSFWDGGLKIQDDHASYDTHFGEDDQEFLRSWAQHFLSQLGYLVIPQGDKILHDKHELVEKGWTPYRLDLSPLDAQLFGLSLAVDSSLKPGEVRVRAREQEPKVVTFHESVSRGRHTMPDGGFCDVVFLQDQDTHCPCGAVIWRKANA